MTTALALGAAAAWALALLLDDTDTERGAQRLRIPVEESGRQRSRR